MYQERNIAFEDIFDLPALLVCRLCLATTGPLCWGDDWCLVDRVLSVTFGAIVLDM